MRTIINIAASLFAGLVVASETDSSSLGGVAAAHFYWVLLILDRVDK